MQIQPASPTAPSAAASTLFTCQNDERRIISLMCKIAMVDLLNILGKKMLLRGSNFEIESRSAKILERINDRIKERTTLVSTTVSVGKELFSSGKVEDRIAAVRLYTLMGDALKEGSIDRQALDSLQTLVREQQFRENSKERIAAVNMYTTASEELLLLQNSLKG